MASKELVFPRGVGRGLSVRQEVGKRERYTSPWSINCRTEDFTRRLRGGSWVPSGPTSHSGVVRSGGYVVANPGSSAPGSSGNADCIYRNRFIRPVGQAIYASRMGDFTDWSMASEISDVARPFVIQPSEAGEIGSNVVALIPHKDAYLIVGTSSSLWVVRADPVGGGSMQNISREVGIVGPRAWCRDHLDRYYFLSSQGLCTISASGDGLQGLSDNVIPLELAGVTDANTVLEYDHTTRSVAIHIPSANQSWLFETEQQAFWPFKVGYEGSHIAIGPLQMADGDSFGRLLRIHGITASGSAVVTWRVVVASSAEQAANNAKLTIEALMSDPDHEPSYVHSKGSWAPGVNHRSYPRARGVYMVLVLSSLGLWGWEGAVCVTEQSGKWR